MDILDIMEARHSVRQYLDRPIEPDLRTALQQEIDRCNDEGHLHIQLFCDEPEAFQAGKPHYGSFTGCRNYLAMVGPRRQEEAIGYYGERLVLKAQELGLNTCWVYLTYDKGSVKPALDKGEKLYLVIALGYGENQGEPHRSKKPERVSDYDEEESPDWFKRGLKAVLLAPTAMNQQKFYICQTDKVVALRARKVPLARIDLGIVKYHFEAAVGKDNFIWA